MMQLDINFSEGFMNDLSTLSNICQENNAESIDIVFKKYNKELKVKISFGLTEEERK